MCKKYKVSYFMDNDYDDDNLYQELVYEEDLDNWIEHSIGIQILEIVEA
mgnify:CR=1 FL=1